MQYYEPLITAENSEYKSIHQKTNHRTVYLYNEKGLVTTTNLIITPVQLFGDLRHTDSTVQLTLLLNNSHIVQKEFTICLSSIR